MISWFNFIFMNPSSENMFFIFILNDHLMMFTTMIMVMIIFNMSFLIYEKTFFIFFSEMDDLEMVWTVVPFLVLLSILIPSLKFLYMMDSIYSPSISFMVIGHQWYWSYHDKNFSMDSYMKKENSMIRLVETDNSLTLSSCWNYRVLGSSADVIHSWTLPSAGFKMDVIPGRVNNMHICLNRTGTFFGQCSEICGINHSFMPIFLESIMMKDM